MVDVKKGHKSFMEFLDKELPPLDLMHWHDAFPRNHIIARNRPEKQRFLFWSWVVEGHEVVAEIIAEPASSTGAKDAFRIQLIDVAMLPKLKELCEKFDLAGFDVKSEIID